MKNLFDLDAERACLSSLMQDISGLNDILLTDRDFYDIRNKRVYQELCTIWEEKILFDIILLSDRLKGTIAVSYLSEIQNFCPLPNLCKQYAEIVRNHAIRRGLYQTAIELQRACQDGEDLSELVSRFSTKIFQASEHRDTGLEHISDILPRVLSEIDAVYGGQAQQGVQTGFTAFDSQIGKWRNGQLIIIAGRPGMGKTALLKTYIESALRSDVGVGMASIEMSEPEIVKRFLSGMSGVSFSDIQSGRRHDRFRSIVDAAQRLSAQNLHFITGGNYKIGNIVQLAHQMKQRHNIGLLVIDYLQLITTEHRTKREEEVSEVSRRLKTLAREINIPVICVAQLNRQCEQRENKRPILADLRESGAVEQDADMVIFLYREDYYRRGERPGIAELIIAKHRNGRTGVLEVAWLPEVMTFQDLERG